MQTLDSTQYVKHYLKVNGDAIYFVEKSDTLRKAAALMINHRVSLLPVTDSHGELRGILMDDDVVEAVKNEQLDVIVSDVYHENLCGLMPILLYKKHLKSCRRIIYTIFLW